MRGYWYPAGNSNRFPANLELKQQTFTLDIEGQASQTGDVNSLDISDRVGNIPRKITFADGALFETTDNIAVDAWLEHSEHEDKSSRVFYILESHTKWIMLALVVAVFLVWGFFKAGVPWISEKVAYALPEQTDALLGEGALEQLDEYMFEPSNLSVQRQNEIQQLFQQKLVPLQDGHYKFNLVFRSMPDSSLKELATEEEQKQPGNNADTKLTKPKSKPTDPGIANAFALPSGDIVITDRLVELAKTPEELSSVLLHEMGHVEYRHSLRGVLESSITTLTILFVVGDVSALNSLVIALPTFLVSNHYSRALESEADDYAFQHMIKGKIDPLAFTTIMDRMEKDGLGPDEQKTLDEEGYPKALEYLASHPNTGDRIEKAKQYSAEFKAAQ